MNVEPRIELEEANKEHLAMKLFNPKPLLHSNHGINILPCINTSLL